VPLSPSEGHCQALFRRLEYAILGCSQEACLDYWSHLAFQMPAGDLDGVSVCPHPGVVLQSTENNPQFSAIIVSDTRFRSGRNAARPGLVGRNVRYLEPQYGDT